MDKFIFTAKGLEYAAKTATGSVLVFTRGKFGDGTTSGDVSRLTDLVKPLGELQISKKTVTENQVTIETQFTNTLSDSATLPPFHLTEIGLFAKLQTSGGADDSQYPETLVCYAHATGSDAGDYIPSTPTEFIINWPFSVSNADNVQITVGLGAFALQRDLDSEAAARAEAEKTLQKNIDNEKSAREAADKVFTENITNETAARNSSEKTLQTNINNEASTRKAEDDKLSSDISAVKTDVANRLKKSVVAALPSKYVLYDFSDGNSIFSTPMIDTTVKGTSTVEADEENGGYYQKVQSTESGTIGSTSNVYSQLEFKSVTENATDVTVEFDFQYPSNGRMKIAIADLDTINALSNSEIRWNTSGIAVDIFSNSNNAFQILGSGSSRPSFFGTWLHAAFVINFVDKKVKYTITNKNDASDIMTGTETLRDANCSKITGIALYTWLQNDAVYLDNISIMARTNVDEHTLYMVPNENGGYSSYIYIDGKPYDIGNEERILEEKQAREDGDNEIISKLKNYALLQSPDLTGTPTAPTANVGANDNQIATTEFVQTVIRDILSKSVMLAPAKFTCNVYRTVGSHGVQDVKVSTTVEDVYGNDISGIYNDYVDMIYGDNASAASSVLMVDFGYSNINKYKVAVFLKSDSGSWPPIISDYTCYSHLLPLPESTQGSPIFTYDVTAGTISSTTVKVN